MILIFIQDNIPLGQVRIEANNKHHIIGISIDQQFRGKGYGKIMLKNALTVFWTKSNNDVYAYIKPDNWPSIKSFENVGFEFQKTTEICECKALEYKIKKTHA